MSKIDVTGRFETGGLTSGLNKAKTEPSEPTQLERQIEVSWKNPRTGQNQSAMITSRVPRGDESRRLPALIAHYSGGVAWELLTPHMQNLALARAEIVHQVVQFQGEPDEGLKWLEEALMVDAYAQLAFKLREALATHRREFFRPDLGEGAGAQGQGGLTVDVRLL